MTQHIGATLHDLIRVDLRRLDKSTNNTAFAGTPLVVVHTSVLVCTLRIWYPRFFLVELLGRFQISLPRNHTPTLDWVPIPKPADGPPVRLTPITKSPST